jgi:purine-nucleoside phosphorylase
MKHMDRHAYAKSVALAAEIVRDQFRIDNETCPLIGVILGSGLGAAADQLLATGGDAIKYESIPGMPSTLVTGHAGRLALGRIARIPVVFLQGRAHYYEGHSKAAVEFGTRLLHAFGVRTLIITNAAGGIRAGFQPGDLMVINSHVRPLAASHQWHQAEYEHGQIPGPTCRGNSGVAEMQGLLWNENLRERIREIESPLQIHEGVYAMMTGPNYETPAEIRMMQTLGADAVGMSTVPEALTAASLGIRVLGVSCITNIAAGLSASPLSHADVTANATSIDEPFSDWLRNAIRLIGSQQQ